MNQFKFEFRSSLQLTQTKRVLFVSRLFCTLFLPRYVRLCACVSVLVNLSVCKFLVAFL